MQVRCRHYILGSYLLWCFRGKLLERGRALYFVKRWVRRSLRDLRNAAVRPARQHARLRTLRHRSSRTAFSCRCRDSGHIPTTRECRSQRTSRRDPVVDQATAIRHAGLPRRGVTGSEGSFPAVLTQNHLAFEHIDELVFIFMPMTLRGGGPWLKGADVRSAPS